MRVHGLSRPEIRSGLFNMTKVLPSYMYRDPADVLEMMQERESKRSCIGCVHAFTLSFNGDIEYGCNKGRRYGKRCKLYAKEC